MKVSDFRGLKTKLLKIFSAPLILHTKPRLNLKLALKESKMFSLVKENRIFHTVQLVSLKLCFDDLISFYLFQARRLIYEALQIPHDHVH